MNDEIILNSCCFFGHRKVTDSKQIKNKAYIEAEELIINKGISIFLFGSKSEFDALCYEVITELKEKYPHIKRIYARAEFQHINDSYKNMLLNAYEDTYYPNSIENSGKAAYVERNREMIDKSEYCVVYYDSKYEPQRRRKCKQDLSDYQPKSGTKIAYEYAVKKKKKIINLYVE